MRDTRHAERRRALRVRLAVRRGGQPARQPRRRARVHRGGARCMAGQAGTVLRRAARHARPTRSQQRRAARRRRVAAAARPRSCAPATASTTAPASIRPSRSSSPPSRRSRSRTRSWRPRAVAGRRCSPRWPRRPPSVTSNCYGVDPNYRLGYVQIWNLDVQRELTRTLYLGVGYIGTKGSSLDLLRAPNRAPGRHAADRRRPAVPVGVVRRRLDHERGDRSPAQAADGGHRRRRRLHALASRSTTPRRLAAEPRSWRRTIRIWRRSAASRASTSGIASPPTSRSSCRSAPTSDGRPGGPAAALLGGWVWNGNVQLASGTPFTARVLGAVTDVARRRERHAARQLQRPADRGQPIRRRCCSSTPRRSRSPRPGTFGNAGRNTIIGPGTGEHEPRADAQHHARADARPLACRSSRTTSSTRRSSRRSTPSSTRRPSGR